MYVWRPSPQGVYRESLSATRLHFQATNADPLGELRGSPRPLAAVGEDNYNISPQFGARCGKGEGEWMCVEWAEMNERGILKPDIVSDFKCRSKCMLGAELRKESIERV